MKNHWNAKRDSMDLVAQHLALEDGEDDCIDLVEVFMDELNYRECIECGGELEEGWWCPYCEIESWIG